MIVKTCDKCGKEIPVEYFGMFVNPLEKMPKIMATRYEQKAGEDVKNIPVDLCTECEDAVFKFIFGEAES